MNLLDDVITSLVGGEDGNPEGAGWAQIIHPGAPCVCGVGFCAQENRCGFYGAWCRDKALDEPQEPDCPHCGAPFQARDPTGRVLCWCCAEHPEPPFRLDWHPAKWALNLKMCREDVALAHAIQAEARKQRGRTKA